MIRSIWGWPLAAALLLSAPSSAQEPVLSPWGPAPTPLTPAPTTPDEEADDESEAEAHAEEEAEAEAQTEEAAEAEAQAETDEPAAEDVEEPAAEDVEEPAAEEVEEPAQEEAEAESEVEAPTEEDAEAAAADEAAQAAVNAFLDARSRAHEAVAVGWALCQPSWSPRAHNIGDYLALRTAMSYADAALMAATSAAPAAEEAPVTADADAAPTHSPTHQAAVDDAADAVITRVSALIGYLNGWLNSGDMPPALEREAVAQRYVLFENLVSLHASVGRCDASQTALDTLYALDAASLGEPYEALRTSATTVRAACMERTTATPAELRETVMMPSRWVSRSLWMVGGTGAVAGFAVAMGEPSGRGDRPGRAAAGLLTGGLGLVVAGTVVALTRPQAEQTSAPARVTPSDDGGVRFSF